MPLVEEFACDYCHDSGYFRLDVPLGDERFGRAMPCPMCRPAPESVGLPDELRGKTFADFDLSRNPSMKPAYEQVRRVADGSAWCALLLGPPGLGKSLLAACALSERFGQFREWGALMREIRELAFGDGMRYPEEYVLKFWQEGDFLLVIDDIGAEKSTEWATGTLYAILNARYQAKLPTILTTNNPDSIDERILSRYAMGAIACRGTDQRRAR